MLGIHAPGGAAACVDNDKLEEFQRLVWLISSLVLIAITAKNKIMCNVANC